MVGNSAQHHILVAAVLAWASVWGSLASTQDNSHSALAPLRHQRRLQQTGTSSRVVQGFYYTVSNNVTDDSIAWGKVSFSQDGASAGGQQHKDVYAYYIDTFEPGQFNYETGFSGVSCVTVSSDNNCSSSRVFWYLVEVSTFLANYDSNVRRLSDPTRLSAQQGLVNESLCTGSCSNKRISLDPAAGYYIMAAYAADGEDDFCSIQYSINTYSDTTGQAACAGLPEPQTFPALTSGAYPQGYTTGIAELYLWVITEEGSATSTSYQVAAAVQNVSCVLLSMWSPTEPQHTLDEYRLFLLSENRLLSGLQDDGRLVTEDDNSVPELAALSLAGGNAQEFNAANRSWLLASNLSMTSTYYVVDTPLMYFSDGSNGGQQIVYMTQAFSSPDVCADLQNDARLQSGGAPPASPRPTGLSSSAPRGNLTIATPGRNATQGLVAIPIPSSNGTTGAADEDLVFSAFYGNAGLNVSGDITNWGRTTLSNVTDPITGMWRQDNSINYSSTLSPGSFEYEFGFSSVSCVTVTFDSNCSSDAMTWYLVEVNRLLSNFDYSAYSNPRDGVSSDAQGFINNSLCVGSCINEHIAVDPNLGYYVMVGNAESSSGGGEICTYQFTMTTDADTSGQSVCQGLAPQHLLPPATSTAYPLGYTAGTVQFTLFTYASGGRTDIFHPLSIATISNASCVLMSIWVPTEASSSLENYRMMLLADNRVKTGLYSNGDLTSDVDLSAPAITALSQASCDGATCNAGNRSWVLISHLPANESYFVIVGPGSYLSNGSSVRQMVIYMTQQFSSPDICASLEMNEATSPPGLPASAAPSHLTAGSPGLNSFYGPVIPATVISQAGLSPPGPETPGPPIVHSSGSSAGAIAGGIVGAVAAVAIIVAGFFLWRRRSRRRSDVFHPTWQVPASSHHQIWNEQPASHADPFLSNVGTSDSRWSAGQPPPSGGSWGPVRQSSVGSSNPSNPGSWLDGKPPRSTGRSGSLGSSDIPGTPGSISRKWAIDVSSLKVCKDEKGSPIQLGSGGFGSVYKALHDDVRLVAVKLLNTGGTGNAAQTQMFWREIEQLAECRDAHLLQFYGAAVNENELLLVTELCEGGDLYHAIHAQPGEHHEGALGWYQRGQSIALDVAKGLHSLHLRNIIHFDLKSPNVLLTREFTAKIGDVGLAHPLLNRTHLSQMSQMRGTWAWQAPETIMGSATSTSADIWSYGVILHELLTGEVPRRGAYRTPRVPQEGPADVVQLMRDCMHEDPARRPAIKEVIARLHGMSYQ